MTPKFELGIKAKDVVTGQLGILTSRTEFLNGCVRYGMSPPVDKENKYVEGYSIDEQQIEKIDNGIIAQLKGNAVADFDDPDTSEKASAGTGGPRGPAPTMDSAIR